MAAVEGEIAALEEHVAALGEFTDAVLERKSSGDCRPEEVWEESA